VILFVLAAHWLLTWTMDQLDGPLSAKKSFMLTTLVVLMLLALATLMAIPFVPGVEIAIALVLLKGPVVAPWVYVATLTGLMAAFFVGRFTPYLALHRFFDDLGLRRAAALLERLEPLNTVDRLAILQERLPRFLRPLALHWRYFLLALALQLPGNSLIGGGGGISLMAGISRLFTTRAVFITYVLAVAPVPLAVYFFGTDFLTKWGVF